MEILHYTQEHIRFRKRLQRFCKEEIIPYIDQWEKNGLVPREVWRKMGREGFLCTAIFPEYGGLGGDFLFSVIALEEMTRTNHYGLDAFLHSDIVVPYIDSFGSDEQKYKYLPGCVCGDIITAVAMTEPDAGSDLSAMATTAIEEDDVVIINGVKTFISNGVNCNLVVIAAKDPTVENPYRAISLYLVEEGTPGFKKGAPLQKLGVHSQDTAELFFSNCRVPKENRLGEKGTGFMILMEKLQQERLLVAILANTMAAFALDWTIESLRTQSTSNGSGQLSQSVRFALVEMSTEIKLGRTFLEKLISDHMEGRDIVSETSMAKFWNTEMANRVVGGCLELCGEMAMSESCPVVRTFRDVRVTPIFAGTNEIMKSIVAKNMKL
ncbi:MAG: acyl-CoA dehydrogenase family protein [Deltaproteobacteria bacterium]|jgi:alkylation response protein AidB-like acyl-CoA dehydrogenase|nr:acyl-CoA dehydrogenase family protein [Deltaproteobacteria bacterium]